MMPITEIDQAAVHQHLLDAGDPTAFLEAFDVLREHIETYLKRTFPHQSAEDCQDIVADVLVGYFKRPAQFNPSKATLPGYLRMAANKDMQNLIAKQTRRANVVLLNVDDFENPDVADQFLARNIDQEESVEEQVLNALTTNDQVTILVESLSPTDKTIVQLMGEGTRDTETFANVLRITHLPIEEQRREVKRCKDRLIKYLQRRLVSDGN